MSKIVIVSGTQIINNPRVVKEATALSEAGYDVTVIGAVFDRESMPSIQAILDEVHWRHVPVVDMAAEDLLNKYIFLFARIRFRILRLTKKFTGWEFVGLLGYFPRRLYRVARLEGADLFIVHQEQAMWVGMKLIKKGSNVAVDFEDWYSEDCLPSDRRLRPLKLLRSLERELLNESVYATTTSHSLAQAFSREFQATPPFVIFNSFPVGDRETIDGRQLDRVGRQKTSIVWFSQKIGPGRGLEELIAALDNTSAEFELHIRGTPRPGYCKSLIQDVSENLKRRIFFHDQVPQKQLLSRLSEHDIGYCGEPAYPPNKNLTISNKMFEYLRAGLVVLASNTKGQLEIALKANGAVHVFDLSVPESLEKALESLLSNTELIEKSKSDALNLAKTMYSWNRSKHQLIRLVKAAL